MLGPMQEQRRHTRKAVRAPRNSSAGRVEAGDAWDDPGTWEDAQEGAEVVATAAGGARMEWEGYEQGHRKWYGEDEEGSEEGYEAYKEGWEGYPADTREAALPARCQDTRAVFEESLGGWAGQQGKRTGRPHKHKEWRGWASPERDAEEDTSYPARSAPLAEAWAGRREEWGRSAAQPLEQGLVKRYKDMLTREKGEERAHGRSLQACGGVLPWGCRWGLDVWNSVGAVHSAEVRSMAWFCVCGLLRAQRHSGLSCTMQAACDAGACNAGACTA